MVSWTRDAGGAERGMVKRSRKFSESSGGDIETVMVGRLALGVGERFRSTLEEVESNEDERGLLADRVSDWSPDACVFTLVL